MSGIRPISQDDRSLVLRCLREAVEGEYFPDWEFAVLMGFTRDELREFVDAAKAPGALESMPNMRHVVGSVLNNLTGYPHGFDARLEGQVGATVEELSSLYDRMFRSAQ